MEIYGVTLHMANSSIVSGVNMNWY